MVSAMFRRKIMRRRVGINVFDLWVEAAVLAVSSSLLFPALTFSVVHSEYFSAYVSLHWA